MAFILEHVVDGTELQNTFRSAPARISSRVSRPDRGASSSAVPAPSSAPQTNAVKPPERRSITMYGMSSWSDMMSPSLLTHVTERSADQPAATRAAVRSQEFELHSHALAFHKTVLDEHGIAVTEKTIALRDRVRVRAQYLFVAAERAHQHQ